MLEAALYLDPSPLLHELFHEQSELIPKGKAVPIRALTLGVGPGSYSVIRSDGKVRDLCAALGLPNFRIPSNVANQDDLVHRAAHGILLPLGGFLARAVRFGLVAEEAEARREGRALPCDAPPRVVKVSPCSRTR